jgi:hypothetical protein
MIAAQSVLVLALIIALYFGLLRPNSPAPLTGAGVPGKPHHHNPHGRPAHRGSRNGARQGNSQGAPGGAQSFAQRPGGPSIPPPSTSPGIPTTPGSDQYLDAVAALNAKLGIPPARVR